MRGCDEAKETLGEMRFITSPSRNGAVNGRCDVEADPVC